MGSINVLSICFLIVTLHFPPLCISTKSHFYGVLRVFFSIYVNLWDTANKIIFFSVCLFFLLTVIGRNEAIIVELETSFVLNWAFITFSGGSHHYFFFAIMKKWCRVSPAIFSTVLLVSIYYLVVLRFLCCFFSALSHIVQVSSPYLSCNIKNINL